MEEKILFEKIKKLSQIQLSEEEKERIYLLVEKKKLAYRKEKPVLIFLNSSYWKKHSFSLAFSAFLIFAFSTFALAQNSLPTSSLYPLKLAYQNLKVALARKDHKAQVKAIVLEERLNDLKKVKDQNNAKVAKLVDLLKQDLKTLPEEISQTQKKTTLLKVSQDVKTRTEKMKESIKDINLENKESLENTLNQTDTKILSLILETSEKIEKCPSYLLKNLDLLKSYFENENNLKNLSPKEVLDIKTVLSEIDQLIKAGDCTGALEKIESLKIFQSIHSLETPVGEPVVENNSLESLDEN